MTSLMQREEEYMGNFKMKLKEEKMLLAKLIRATQSLKSIKLSTKID